MNVLVLYYSMTGNVFRMSQFVAEGVKEGAATAVIKTVPDPLPQAVIEGNEAIRKAKADQSEVPVASPEELGDYEGIVVGTPTRFGNMCPQMSSFWEQTGTLWQQGALIGKPVGAFTSTATLHGGQETTIVASMLTFLHHGMIIVGVPYSEPALSTPQAGGSPYGPSHTAGNPPANPVTDDEATVCRTLGRRVAEVAAKLSQ